ncbi:MAG: L,D-transpeptidase family protein [Proteobacteria bacterium]|nr:L,D-transpeptidase family protein [Pseudomonadota bacterium]
MKQLCFKIPLLLALLFHSTLALCYQNIHPGAKAKSLKQAQIDTILVEKHKRIMTVFHKDKALKTYRIALGFSPDGHKLREGDGKTPEGTYFIVGKNPQSKFHLSLKISYPSVEQQQNAKQHGINPGGNIMIHGLAPHLAGKGKWHSMRDWTLGCIAVTNDEIEELFKIADVGTKVVIIP